jgi:hypothetical protein
MLLHKNVLRWPAILDSTADPVTPIKRVLLPAYLLKGVPMAWECTECRKLFSRNVEEVLSHPAQEPPDSIRREFEHHRCALHLLPN